MEETFGEKLKNEADNHESMLRLILSEAIGEIFWEERQQNKVSLNDDIVVLIRTIFTKTYDDDEGNVHTDGEAIDVIVNKLRMSLGKKDLKESNR